MADNHPTVDDVPQNLKPAGIEIPNDSILAAQAAYVHAAPNISAERAWAETLFARDFDVMRAAVAVLNDTGNYTIEPISYNDDVRMMDDFVRNLGDQPLTVDTYNKALRATVFNQFTDPADPYDETNLRNTQAVLDAVADMRYPLNPENLHIGQHIESKFRMSPDRRMDENALKDYADASLMVQIVGDNPLAEQRSPEYQRDMQRLMMAQLAHDGDMAYDPMYAFEAIRKADDQFNAERDEAVKALEQREKTQDVLQSKFNADYSNELNNIGESLDTVVDQEVDNSRFEDKLAEIENLPSGFDSVDIGYDDGDEPEPDQEVDNSRFADQLAEIEDLPSGFDSIDSGYDDGDEPEPPSASSLVKPDANSKNGPSDRLKQVKDMTSRVYDEPSGSDGLSLG